jgi:hypothetical protein
VAAAISRRLLSVWPRIAPHFFVAVELSRRLLPSSSVSADGGRKEQAAAPGFLPVFLAKTIFHTDLFSEETIFPKGLMVKYEKVFYAFRTCVSYGD